MEVDHETRISRKSVCAGWLWFLCAFLWECWWRIVTWRQQLIDGAAVRRCHTSSASSENHSWWCHTDTATVGCGGPRYVHTVKHETADPFNLNKAGVGRGRFPPLCCFLQFICAANCFCYTHARVRARAHTHTHSYTHATRWCRCSEGKDAPKYFRNRLAAERNMKLMKGTAERQSRKGSSVRWKELGLFDDEW